MPTYMSAMRWNNQAPVVYHCFGFADSQKAVSDIIPRTIVKCLVFGTAVDNLH